MKGQGQQKSYWTDRIWGKILLGSILPVLVIFFWWIGIKSGTAVVPAFSEILRVLVHSFETSPDLYSWSQGFSLMMTLPRLFIGFGLGILIAVPLGFWAGQNRVVDSIYILWYRWQGLLTPLSCCRSPLFWLAGVRPGDSIRYNWQ